jgi:hypothetical protein
MGLVAALGCAITLDALLSLCLRCHASGGVNNIAVAITITALRRAKK